MDYRFSNTVDIFRMKRSVVAHYESYALLSQRRARELLSSTRLADRCPICKGDKSDIAMVMHGFQYRHCLNCTHVYHPETIPDERLEQFYTDTGVDLPYSATYSDDIDAQKVREQSAATPKVDYIANFMKEDLKRGKKSWLDIACGNGDVLGVAKSRGFEVFGIELSPALAELARNTYGIQVYEGNLLKYNGEDKRGEYDVVTFIGILDALPDPQGYLKVAREMTRVGGLLAINVPHFNSLSAAIQKSYPDLSIRFAFPNAFHLFTERSLTEAITRNGFEPIGIWFYGMDIYELINNLSLESFRFRNSEARQILISVVNELQHVIDTKHLSDEILMVARKVS